MWTVIIVGAGGALVDPPERAGHGGRGRSCEFFGVAEEEELYV